MPYCSKCGAKLDEDAKFCPTCGTTAGAPVAERSRTRREKRRPMSTKTITLVVLLVVMVVAAGVGAILLGLWRPSGRVVGSGNLTTEEEYFSDFTIVDVESGFEVEITQSSSYRIRITADDNLFDYIEVTKTGNKLRIRLKWGYSYQNPTLRAKIAMPALRELQLSGGTHGTVKEFSSSQGFVLEMSGGSFLQGDLTTSGDVQFTLSGGSHLTDLDGTANNLRISASLGSHLDLSDFSVHNADVELSGGSHATINLDGTLDANLSGGSHLLYIGNPTMGNIDTSGGSTVEPAP